MLAIATAAFALIACNDQVLTETLGYVPPSSVIIRAESLAVACGEGETQASKYRVTLRSPQPAGPSPLYECFADAYLIPDDGDVEATVEIFSRSQVESNSFAKPLAVRLCKGEKQSGIQSVLACAAAPVAP
jgi:hypothetical protein